MADVIAKSVTVDAAPESAFQLWVDRIDAWWPKAHSRSRDPRTVILLEGRPGGRFFERTSDGEEYDFGLVVTYDPPHHLAYHWYLGSSEEKPTMVDVRFTADGPRTRIDVEHRGPELIGVLWDETNAGFDRAWEHVLTAYANFWNEREKTS